MLCRISHINVATLLGSAFLWMVAVAVEWGSSMRSIRCVVAEMKIGVASVSSYLSLVNNTKD